MIKTEANALKAQQAVVSPPLDRRRHDRIENIASTLIPLFRQPAVLVKLDFDEGDDDPCPARGVAFAFILSVPLWGLIIFGFWLAC